MAGLNDQAQWIVLLGLIISLGIFFLAIILNQSILVGQTTAESVLEFPKSDIQDLRSEVRFLVWDTTISAGDRTNCIKDIVFLALERKSSVINITPGTSSTNWVIHYNNGVTEYNEQIIYWDF